MTPDEIKFDLLKQELELTQGQMDKYDELSSKIKTWAVTLSAAILGWYFQVKQREIVLLVIFVAFTFWILDAVNKNFREGYKKRRNEVAQALRKIFHNPSVLGDFVAPDFPERNWSAVVGKFFEPHIFILYFSLIAVALIISFVV